MQIEPVPLTSVTSPAAPPQWHKLCCNSCLCGGVAGLTVGKITVITQGTLYPTWMVRKNTFDPHPGCWKPTAKHWESEQISLILLLFQHLLYKGRTSRTEDKQGLHFQSSGTTRWRPGTPRHSAWMAAACQGSKWALLFPLSPQGPGRKEVFCLPIIFQSEISLMSNRTRRHILL